MVVLQEIGVRSVSGYGVFNSVEEANVKARKVTDYFLAGEKIKWRISKVIPCEVNRVNTYVDFSGVDWSISRKTSWFTAVCPIVQCTQQLGDIISEFELVSSKT